MTWTKKHHEKIGFQLQISQCFPTLNFWKDLSPKKRGCKRATPKIYGHLWLWAFCFPANKTWMQKDYVRVKLPVSALLAVCVLMSTVSWQSKVIRLTRWLGFFWWANWTFFSFVGTGMCFQMFVFWWEMNGLTNQRLVLVCIFIV